jgi:ABC-type antimicrobial peptide transport system permease subunit
VGVVADTRPYTDFMIRSTMAGGDVTPGVRRAVREVSPAIRLDVRPFDQTIRDGLLPERLMAALAGFFGCLAALIAAVGLYGVMSHLVSRRRNEIGVRMALGSTRAAIVAMVLRQGAKLLGIGCAVGSVLAMAGAGLARSLVFGLEPWSIGTIGLTSLLLAVVATAACCLPAVRAARLEPRDALRNEMR